MIYLRGYKDEVASITDYGRFPDNTLLTKVSICHTNEIVWRYENDSELFAVYCIAKPIFKDGKLLVKQTLTEIRQRLHQNKF